MGGGRPVLRSGAKAGDAICVTGALGGSILGRHLSFVPRIELALALTKRAHVHAMMDLSDGLAQDLPRMCARSGVGAMVAPGQLPISEDAYTLAERDGIPAGLHALADGEDYELLFTVPESELPKLFGHPMDRSFVGVGGDVPITRIGTITAETGLYLLGPSDEKLPWPRAGWEHRGA